VLAIDYQQRKAMLPSLQANLDYAVSAE
jgi:hypothetical protein